MFWLCNIKIITNSLRQVCIVSKSRCCDLNDSQVLNRCKNDGGKNMTNLELQKTANEVRKGIIKGVHAAKS